MKRVVNPYNFVPFSQQAPDRVSPEKTYGDAASLLYGYLEVQLKNTSPLIVPEGKPYSVSEKDHKSYHFFRLPDENRTPAIPGSEVRGMIRSVYEAVTNSCTTVLLDHNDYSMRTPPSGAFKTKGILEFDIQTKAWRLYKAVENAIRLNEQSFRSDLTNQNMRFKGKYRNGQQVLFTGSGLNVRLAGSADAQARKGWIMFNNPVQAPQAGKKTQHYKVNILEKASTVPMKVWPADAKGNPCNEPFRMLDEILDPQKTPKDTRRTNTQRDYWANLKEIRKSGGCIPVWYLEVSRGKERLFYLSNAAIGRVHMNRSWEDVMGSHAPCTKYDCLCPACRLFGTVADGGIKSRLHFTDALYVDGEISPDCFGTRTLAILSTPRPSAFEFYIEKPNDRDVRYWNYDYYGTHAYEGLKYKDMSDPSPRGRKFYWHGKVNPQNEAPGNQNSTMEFLKEGHHFAFRIYFDGITSQQLSDLEYAVTLGENKENSDMQLKIGHARPLGYGSVKLTVRKAVLRQLKRDGDHISVSVKEEAVPESIPAPAQKDPVPLLSLKAICNRKNTMNKEVAYPKWQNNPRNGATIYDWFSYNRRGANDRNGGNNWAPLPEPTAGDITLPSWDGSSGGGSSYGGSSRPNNNNRPMNRSGQNSWGKQYQGKQRKSR